MVAGAILGRQLKTVSKKSTLTALVVHAFNSNIQEAEAEAEAGYLYEFEGSLV